MKIRVRRRLYTSKYPTPIRAWKTATIIMDYGRPRFRPMVINECYDAAPSTFKCYCNWFNSRGILGTPRHEVPAGDANCGFYALKTPDIVKDEYKHTIFLSPTSDGSIPWLLEVDLWGTVVRCSRGYRASRQRVLSARPLFPGQAQVTWNGLMQGQTMHLGPWPFVPKDPSHSSTHLAIFSNPADLAAAMKTDIYPE